jgi:hypothetical protein
MGEVAELNIKGYGADAAAAEARIAQNAVRPGKPRAECVFRC